MLNVIEVYEDCADQINVQENGQFDYATFNRFSWRAQLRLLDWLSGDISGRVPPEPYLTQKNADWLIPFMSKYPTNVSNGIITRPDDYYLWQKMSLLRGNFEDCNEDIDAVLIPDKVVTLLGIDKFDPRANTYIKLLKPSFDNPIAQQVGKTFEIYPKDVGSAVLYYIRYPAKAEIKTTIDTLYNQEIPDVNNSVNFEWDEGSRETLVWFIVDLFSNRERERALKETNLLTGKNSREGK